MRIQDSRCLKQLVQLNFDSKNNKTGCRWVREIREDQKDIGLTTEVNTDKKIKQKKIEDKNTHFTFIRKKHNNKIFQRQKGHEDWNVWKETGRIVMPEESFRRHSYNGLCKVILCAVIKVNKIIPLKIQTIKENIKK